MKKPLITPDIIRLKDIRNAIDDACALNRKDLEDKYKLYGAAFCLNIIGEASRQISDNFKTDHPDLPWRDMADTRNRIVHEYDDLDVDALIQIIEDELPPLKEKVEKILLPALDKLGELD